MPHEKKEGATLPGYAWNENSHNRRMSLTIRFGTVKEGFPNGSLEALVEPHGDDIHWNVRVHCLCCGQEMMEPRYDVLEGDIISLILNYSDY